MRGTLPLLLRSQLRHVYRGQCFRDWWNRPERARAPERLQWMNFRKKARVQAGLLLILTVTVTPN